MDWFFALNEAGAFRIYADLAKVAVHTALAHTSLRPRMLYDGNENALTRWMRDRGVEIIPAQSRFKTELLKLTGVAPAHLTTLPGVFLRIELPSISERLGITDNVLYTDCDVMFRRDIADELSSVSCQYFAAAPEFDPNDYYHINTGVLLMNLPTLRQIDTEFLAFVRGHLQELTQEAWDQGAYRRFFGWERDKSLWDRLPQTLNWKTYWGDPSNAGIIHFHGPKPYEFRRPTPELQYLVTPEYHSLSQEWHRLLERAG